MRVRLTAQLDMALTGKRHPFLARFDAGFDDDGRCAGAEARALFRWRLEPRPLRARHLARACSTATTPICCPRVDVDGSRLPDAQDLADGLPRLRRTAGHAGHRGHSRPRRAQLSGSRPHLVRERNFYREGDHTHYGAASARTPARIERIWRELKRRSDFDGEARGDRRLQRAASAHASAASPSRR